MRKFLTGLLLGLTTLGLLLVQPTKVGSQQFTTVVQGPPGYPLSPWYMSDWRLPNDSGPLNFTGNAGQIWPTTPLFIRGYETLTLVVGSCTFVGTISVDISPDNGASFITSTVMTNAGTQTAAGAALNNPSGTNYTVFLAGHESHARARLSSYTSGSCTVRLIASHTPSPFAVGGLTVGLAGLGAPLWAQQVGGVDGSGNEQKVGAKATNPAATDVGLTVRPIDGLASLVTLQASQGSAVVNGTTTRQTTTGLDRCRTLDILFNPTAAGSVTGTLQVFVQDSWDGGTTWDDLWASNTYAFGSAAVKQRAFINGYLIQSTITSATPGVQAVLGSSTAPATETLTTGSTRQGPFGDRTRVREVITAISGSPTQVTYTITAICKA